MGSVQTPHFASLRRRFGAGISKEAASQACSYICATRLGVQSLSCRKLLGKTINLVELRAHQDALVGATDQSSQHHHGGFLMDTETLNSLTTCFSANKTAGRTALRLVSSSLPGNVMPAAPTQNAAVPCLVLKSALGDKNIVNESTIVDLFHSLRTGERIEFSHTVHRDEHGNPLPGNPYRLRIRVAASTANVEALKLKVAGVFASAFPGFHFVAGGSAHAVGLTHTSQFAPAGAIATDMPSPRKFSSEWNQSPTLSRLMNSNQKVEQLVLPFPEDMPNWAYSAPFSDPLSLPTATEITIRIHGFALDEQACEKLHRTLFRIQAGNYVLFHPHSPITSHSVAIQLKDPASALLRQWLQHPCGYAVDCVVKSSCPLGEVAQSRIASDLFGKRPFHQVRQFENSSPETLSSPEFAWAVAKGQGLPALMPAQSVLSALAIPRHFAAPKVTPPQSGALIGETVCGRRSSTVHLPFASRSRHTAIFGSTGSGKSTLMTQMMAADIADPNRQCGIGLIDPHGSLYQQVLEMIPPDRADDVILVDTSDPTSTACLNPLEGIKDDPLHANFVVSELMSLIELLFESQTSTGPLLKSNLRNLFLLTGSTPGRHPCILDAVRILEDTKYAEYLMSKCTDRNVLQYWGKFSKTTGSEHGYLAWAPYMLARLTPFVASPIMKRLINRPHSSIDLGKAMQERKIVLFNLNKGVLSEAECQVLGSLVLSKFFAAALGRAKVPEGQRPPFHLYVDEFASFANDATPRLFSEARKFNLCLNVAFQSLSQLENRWGRSNIATSVLANTGTKFMMRLGPADVSTLEPYFQPQFDASAMTALPDFHAVACMTDNNRSIPPFVLKAKRPTPDPAKLVPVQTLENLSRARYGMPIEQANQELSQLFALDLASLGPKSQHPALALQPLSASMGATESASFDQQKKVSSGLIAKWRAAESVK